MDHEAIETTFWKYILVHCYGTSDTSSLAEAPDDPEGYALFSAIQSAVTSNYMSRDIEVSVNRELVQYLAGWCRDSCKGYHQKGGPYDPGHNHFARRAYRAFLCTVMNAAKHGGIQYTSPDRPMYGCFPIPQWLIDHCVDEVYNAAHEYNRMWDRGVMTVSTAIDGWQFN